MTITNLFFKSRSYVVLAILFILTTSERCNDLSPVDTNVPPTALALSVLTILENQTIGTEVATFSTTDADAEDSHSYSLVSGEGDSDNNSFIIDGINLITNVVFDFETQNVYSIRVQTDDGKGGTFEMTFSISVIDIDDQPPSIVADNYSISESASVGERVGQIIANDNISIVSYRFISGNTAGAFRISDDGLITVASLLDFETLSAYILNIEVRDQSGNTTTANFPIMIRDTTTFSSTDNVFDDNILALNGIYSMATALISGTTYLFVGAIIDDGISVFSIDSDGILTNVDNIYDDNTLALDGIYPITTAVVSETTYLFGAGFHDNGVSVFSVAADGTLTNVDNVYDNDTWKLHGVASMSTADVFGTTYLFVGATVDDGISVFSVASDGTLTNVDNVSDNNILALNGVVSLSTAVVSGMTYLFGTGVDDDGISVFSVASDGTLTNVYNVSDNETLALDGTFSLSTIDIFGKTYLFGAGNADHGISVFSVASDGTLMNIDNVFDNDTLALNGVISISVVSEQPFLYASGNGDDGVSIFQIAADGTLTNINNIFDDDTLALDGTRFVCSAIISGKIFLFVSGANDKGISVFQMVD